MLCDQHVRKMIIESTQMLMSWYYQKHGSIVTHKQYKENYTKILDLTRDFPRETPYGLGFPHHPCTQWLLQSDQNVVWLVEHLDEMLVEFMIRFKKVHAVQKILFWFTTNVGPRLDTSEPPTEFVMAMPTEYMRENVVTSYQLFYVYEKSKFATWKVRSIPEWYNELLFLKGSRKELVV